MTLQVVARISSVLGHVALQDERWAQTLSAVVYVERNPKCQGSETALQDLLSEIQL
jgi:hypothetical protein